MTPTTEQVGQAGDQAENLGTQDLSQVEGQAGGEGSEGATDTSEQGASEETTGGETQGESTEGSSTPDTTEQDALAAAAAQIASSAEVQAPAIETETKPTTPAQDATIDERIAYIEDARANGTDVQKRILAAVETYCSQMVPRTIIQPAVCAGYQHEFLQHLMWLLDKPYDEFRKGWNLLLVYFACYHGESNTPAGYTPLSEYSTNRHLSAWSKGEDLLELYKNLVTLIRATRRVETRQHDIKTIKLEKVGPGVLEQEALTNLQKFYEV